MSLDHVQSLVVRAPNSARVAHKLLRVPTGCGRAAACLLADLKPSFGPQSAESGFCSVGFSFAGLEALGVPEAYLRTFRRLAPAFSLGAVRRSPELGDSGDSVAPNWWPQFRQGQAHVLLSWHGDETWVEGAEIFAKKWEDTFREEWIPVEHRLEGKRLGSPPDEQGEWLHFRMRHGLTEICIDEKDKQPVAVDPRRHAAGALLLGAIDDAGSNRFALGAAPEKVRSFFHDSSFGILRLMEQDVAAFNALIKRQAVALAKVYEPPVSLDFVRAKLLGRWPDGRQILPGERLPGDGPLKLDLSKDEAGQGCPFGSHVRRLRAAPDASKQVFERPLQRRSVPFGKAYWGDDDPGDNEPRGLLGHFFCASIEDQFEHLLGQWAARPPLGFPTGDQALDPLIGPQDDLDAPLAVPLKDRPTQSLTGFSAWTTTLGTMYGWYPAKAGWKALVDDDFISKEDEGPWL